MRYEVLTLGKRFLQIHTEKGFTLYANAHLDSNGNLGTFTDSMYRRGGSWVIDVWKFLTKKEFPVNPIYTAVFGFDENDNAVQVNATDIDVESISGVNGQLVDVGNISLPRNQSLAVNEYGGREVETIYVEYDNEFEPVNIPVELGECVKLEGLFKYSPEGQTTGIYSINGFLYKLSYAKFSTTEEPLGWWLPTERTIYKLYLYKKNNKYLLQISTDSMTTEEYRINESATIVEIPVAYLYGKVTLVFYQSHKVLRIVF